MTGHNVRHVGAPTLDIWSDLVRSDPTALIFQTPQWMRCLTHCGWVDASRLYKTRDERLLVLPLAVRQHRPTRTWVLASLPSGWGTGGLLARGGARLEDIAAVASQLTMEPFLQVRLRPTFLAAAAWERASLPPGRHIPRRVHVLDLRGGMDQVWEQRFGSRTRQGMRTARRRTDEAGITVQCGHAPELVRQFYDLYLQWVIRRAVANGIPVRLARARATFAEPRRTFQAVAQEIGDQCRIRVASLRGHPVAATVTLLGDRTAIYWRGYDDRETARRLHVPELLHLAAIKDACEHGCDYYEMGESGGIASLERFKLKLGARPQDITEYRLERVPLSALQDGVGVAVERLGSLLTLSHARGKSSPT